MRTIKTTIIYILVILSTNLFANHIDYVCTPILLGVPEDITVECDNVPNPSTNVTATCDGEEVTIDFVETIENGACTDSYVLIRTWTANSLTNTTSEVQRVTVGDTTPPIISNIPADMTIECDNVPGPPTNIFATDNCDTEVEVTFEEVSKDGMCINSYFITRTWMATDNCGNVVKGIQVVTVEDSTNPILQNIPDDITLSCSETLPNPNFVTATDNCYVNATVEFVQTETGVCPNKILTRTWSSTDDCGNMVIEKQIISLMGEGDKKYYLKNQDDVDFLVANPPTNGDINELIIGEKSGFMDFSDIHDISGLSFFTNISGDLIIGNTQLKTLDGLDKIETIGGNLIIKRNFKLTNIQNNFSSLKSLGSDININATLIKGFNKLTSIGGDLLLSASSITGFNGLNSIGGSFLLSNADFTDWSGFEKLTIINNDLQINGTNIQILPFKKLTTIKNKLRINNCKRLTSLKGLESLSSTKHLVIENNESLTDCTALCYLFQINGVTGVIEFNHNPSACSSQSAIESECDDPEEFMLRTQSDIDDFIRNYSTTSTITGNLIIGDNEAPFTTSDISDISGLSFIKTIVGDLYIGFNNSLENLNGLENLTAITGDVIIKNNDSLSKFRDNESITVGFENISQIGGDLQILENNALGSLNGLEKLSTIGGKLVVSTNANLSDCKGICNILENDGVAGSIFIIANPSGCSTLGDVEQSCMSGSSDLLNSNLVLISPNPAGDYMNISSLNGQPIENVVIYNQFGKEMMNIDILKNEIDISKLPIGMYIAKMKIGNQFAIQKFIKL